MSDPRGKEERTFDSDYNSCLKHSQAMLKKLRENSHKAHWSTVSTEFLLDRLLEEVEELAEALDYGSTDDIVSECADVSNFAMMIAEKAKGDYYGLV